MSCGKLLKKKGRSVVNLVANHDNIPLVKVLVYHAIDQGLNFCLKFNPKQVILLLDWYRISYNFELSLKSVGRLVSIIILV